jgi:PilZ domain
VVDDEFAANAEATEERRLHDRSRLIVDVFFDGKDATGVASTKDISVGGLYMHTQANLPEGSLLMIRIPVGEGEQIVANAEVIYSNEGRGVGLRFQGLSADDRTKLEREIGNA